MRWSSMGLARRRRNWDCLRGHPGEPCARCRKTRRLLVQSASRCGVFRTMPTRRACSSPTATWSEMGHPGAFSTTRPQGYDVRHMTAGSAIYSGAGLVQGTTKPSCEAGASITAAASPGAGSSRRLGGMGGAQPWPAASPARWSLIIECQQSRIDFRCGNRTSMNRPPTRRRAGRASPAHGTEEGGGRSPCRQRGRKSCRCSSPRAAGANGRPRHRTRTSRPRLVNGYCRRAWASIRVAGRAAEALQHAALREAAGARARQAMLDFQGLACPRDYGNNIRQVASTPASERLSPTRVVPATSAAVLPRQRAVPLGGLSATPRTSAGPTRR